MPRRYDVIPATIEHVRELANLLRPEDVDDIDSYRPGENASEVLVECFRASTDVWAGMIDGKPACLFGALQPKYFVPIANPWFRGSERLRGHELAFLRLSRKYVKRLAAHYGELRNLVDANNAKAINWLEWLGFDVEEKTFYFPGNPIAFRPYSLKGVK